MIANEDNLPLSETKEFYLRPITLDELNVLKQLRKQKEQSDAPVAPPSSPIYKRKRPPPLVTDWLQLPLATEEQYEAANRRERVFILADGGEDEDEDGSPNPWRYLYDEGRDCVWIHEDSMINYYWDTEYRRWTPNSDAVLLRDEEWYEQWEWDPPSILDFKKSMSDVPPARVKFEKSSVKRLKTSEPE